MKTTMRSNARPYLPGDPGVKVGPQGIPTYLGTLTSDGRLCHAYADGTILPVIAGGSTASVEVEKPALLTVPEFAAELRIAPSTAWDMVSANEVESIVIGRKSRRIPREALTAYIEQRRAEAKTS